MNGVQTVKELKALMSVAHCSSSVLDPLTVEGRYATPVLLMSDASTHVYLNYDIIKHL